MDNNSRKMLFRWAGWFALANSVVFGLVSLRYFSAGVPVESAISIIYLLCVYIGHHVLLTTIPLVLLATPLIVLFPRKRLVTWLAVVLFALLVFTGLGSLDFWGL